MVQHSSGQQPPSPNLIPTVLPRQSMETVQAKALKTREGRNLLKKMGLKQLEIGADVAEAALRGRAANAIAAGVHDLTQKGLVAVDRQHNDNAGTITLQVVADAQARSTVHATDKLVEAQERAIDFGYDKIFG
jgi:hypothetical protein